MTQVDVDPDPTPTATPWEEYLAAAQSLDAVRRDAAATAAEATYAVSAARAELDQLRSRLQVQRARLTGEAVRAGLAAPQLLPTPAEQAAATAVVGGDPAAVPAALHQCRELVAACDAQLAGAAAPGPGVVPAAGERRSWWPPGSLVAVTLLSAVTLLGCSGLVLLYLLRWG